MSLAASIIERAEAVKAQEGRYPTVWLPAEEFAALLAECRVQMKGKHPVRLRGIIVNDYGQVERKGEWDSTGWTFTKRR